MRRSFTCSAVFALAIAATAAQAPQAPTFQVDPLWPRPLGNHWLLGSVTGVTVDAQNHIWVVHRGAASMTARTEIGLATTPPTAEACCAPAPFVLRFDPAGNVVSHWGGPGQGYEWPASPSGIAVDGKGNVWIAAAGPPEPPPGGGRGRGTQAPPPPTDAHVLKFTRDGKFLLQIGKAGAPGDASSTTALHRPTSVDVDDAAGEVYVADGLVNGRVVVFDAESGKYKRHWTAPVSCVALSRDGLVYACDRRNNKILVFKKDGTPVKEAVVAKETRAEGSTWDVAFSNDAQQRFLYVADGSNQKVWTLRRDTLAVASSMGIGGRWPGAFYAVGSVAVDASGNLYTGEAYEGKRVQKFIFKGMGRANSEVQR
jgi:DNA-binding beta-propeller fold protein YncE